MTSLDKGSGVVSKAIEDLANTLVDTLPSDVHLLIGITVTDSKTGQKIVVDLTAVAKTAVIVGLDGSRKEGSGATLRSATRLIRQLQQDNLLSLPVYAHWLAGDALEGYPDGYSDATVIEQAIMQANQDKTLADADAEAGFALIELLRREDALSTLTTENPKDTASLSTPTTADSKPPASLSTPRTADSKGLTSTYTPTLPSQPPRHPSARRQLRRRSRGLGELPGQAYKTLKEGFLRLIIPHRAEPIRPVQVAKELKKAMLARENYLEDARYRKIVPNLYVVELNQHNYKRYYQPIESELYEQWPKQLKEHLSTTNTRLRSNEYICLGPIEVQIKPVSDLAENEVDIKCEIVKRKEIDPPPPAAAAAPGPAPALLPAYLDLPGSGRQWPLREGIITIGRDEECDVYLDIPMVQKACLISGKHAYILSQENSFCLFDGSRQRGPSTRRVAGGSLYRPSRPSRANPP